MNRHLRPAAKILIDAIRVVLICVVGAAAFFFFWKAVYLFLHLVWWFKW